MCVSEIKRWDSRVPTLCYKLANLADNRTIHLEWSLSWYGDSLIIPSLLVFSLLWTLKFLKVAMEPQLVGVSPNWPVLISLFLYHDSTVSFSNMPVPIALKLQSSSKAFIYDNVVDFFVSLSGVWFHNSLTECNTPQISLSTMLPTIRPPSAFEIINIPILRVDAEGHYRIYNSKTNDNNSPRRARSESSITIYHVWLCIALFVWCNARSILSLCSSTSRYVSRHIHTVPFSRALGIACIAYFDCHPSRHLYRLAQTPCSVFD